MLRAGGRGHREKDQQRQAACPAHFVYFGLN
jgi:hypothetical protein